MKKSHVLQFVLALLFGPLGLFYSSVAAAIAMIIAAIIFGSITFGVALVIVWPLSILIGFGTVYQHNSKVVLEQRRHEELVRAFKSS